MMKKITTAFLSLVLAVSFAFTGSASAASADVPQTVRVGLEAYCLEKSSIAITNGAVFFGYEQNGQFVNSGELRGTLAVVPAGQFFVRLPSAFGSFAQAQAAAAGIGGYTAFPGFVAADAWHVYLGGFATEQEATAARNAVNTAGTVLAANGSRVAVTANGHMALIFDNSTYNLQLTGHANDPLLYLGNRSYRGRVEFGRYAGKNVTAVNVVPLEEYLYSVVASEMPQAWHIEALKAQSCAARTYAVSRIGRHASAGYDLCDTTHCQVYTGKGGEAESTRNAVDATRGVLIYYNNTPIADAVYCSSSGGMTDNSENVWVSAVPYLRSVPEINEPTAKQWSVTYTMAELSALLRNRGTDIGTVSAISIDRVENQRVQAMTLTGTNGSRTLTKQEITSVLALDSRLFTIGNSTAASTPASASVLFNGTPAARSLSGVFAIGANGQTTVTGTGTIYVTGAGGTRTISPSTGGGSSSVSGAASMTFTGAGWGHGVGMSQHGAKGMAEIGYGYADILRHYYTGVEVR